MNTGKRLFDIAVSVAGLIFVWPLLLIVAVLVKTEDGGDALFRQERVGRDGRPFRMWKFRTMVPNAGSLGPLLTASRDERITRVGASLRRMKLDELPQLFNVLTGEMAMVGPRPEVPEYVAAYTPEQRRVLALTPGITDRASIEFIDEAAQLEEVADPERYYLEHIMPAKIQLNLEYAKTATRWQDLVVIIETLRRVLPRERSASAESRPVYLPAVPEP